MPSFKLINSYDAGGDITKEWFVHYHFLIPKELQKPNGKKYERFKVYNTINSIHNKKERLQQLKFVKDSIKELLEAGFNPFQEFSYADNSQHGKYNICNCIDEYIRFIKSTLKRNTVKTYTDRLLVFKGYLIEMNLDYKRIDQLSKSNIFDFVKTFMINRKWSNRTYNHYLQAINTMLQFFVDNKDDYLKENVCAKIKRLPFQKKGNLPFNNVIFKKMLDYMKDNNPNLYQFSRFIYYSCMRPDAELRLLRVGDIDLHRRLIQVPSENSKRNKTQYIPIDDEFLNILLDMNLDRFNKYDYVFSIEGSPGEKPVYESYFRKQFIPVKKALDINSGETLYSFKHTRCIHLVEDGEKLHNIIKLTRHKTLAELMDYLKDMGVIFGDEVRLKSRSI